MDLDYSVLTIRSLKAIVGGRCVVAEHMGVTYAILDANHDALMDPSLMGTIEGEIESRRPAGISIRLVGEHEFGFILFNIRESGKSDGRRESRARCPWCRLVDWVRSFWGKE
jgi:hypothetical protein